MSVVTEILGIAGDEVQAGKTNEFNRNLYRETTVAATIAALEDFVALRERAYQERQAAAQEIQGITAESRQALAGAKLQALESGTGGRSVELLLADFERNELRNSAVSADNLAAVERQLGLEARKAVARRNDRIAASVRPFVQGSLGALTNVLGESFTGVEQTDSTGSHRK